MATTVAPITDLVARVGGPAVAVTGIIPEGVNSHTFEPPPSAARTLAEADVVFANGLALEAGILELAAAVHRPDAPIVALGDLAIGRADWRFDFSFPEEAGDPNPHLWPNAELAMRYVEQIRATLTALAPEHRALFGTNAAALRAQLSRLDGAIFACVASIPPAQRQLVTYHDSFAYFAPRYGMTVVGAVQPADFGEPSAQDVANIIRQVRALGVPAIFGSEVFPSTVLEQIAEESGARYVDSLRDDDLPGEPGDPQHSLVGMMAANVRTITEALGGDAGCLDGLAP